MIGGESAIGNVTFPKNTEEDWGRYTLWHLAEVACDGDGWALLGELEKIVPVSPQRVAAIDTTCGAEFGMEVSLVGAPGEAVELTFLSPDKVLTPVSATIGADGMAVARAA